MKNGESCFSALKRRSDFYQIKEKVKTIFPDSVYLKRFYRLKFHKKLDLKNPKTYNEKLQWIKLYDRKPIYSQMVDKYEVKQYVANIIGEQYIIPTIGVWDKFEDIDFNILPDKFVIKCTHDSGGLIIVKNKKDLDIAYAKQKINNCLMKNYYYSGREWPYKNVKPRIIVEEFLENKEKDGPINDYKIYTFNGISKICMINQDRGIHTKADYFDKDFNWLDFTWGYDHAEERPQKPTNYEKMFELAEKLSVGTIELRVDFYEINGRIYFGELTFFDGSGFDIIKPEEWDYKLGEMLNLPNKTKTNNG